MTGFRMPFPVPGTAEDERALAQAAAHAIEIAQSGDSRAGLAHALQARGRAQALGSAAGEAHALNAAAIVHLLRRDAISAIAAAMDAAGAAARAGERSQLGHARVSLAVSAGMLDGGGELVPQILECVAEAVAAGDTVLEVRARSALAILRGDRGEFDAAAAELLRALLLAGTHPGMTRPSRLLANMANLHRKRAVAGPGAAFAQDACRSAAPFAVVACAQAAAEGSLPVEIDALAIYGALRRLQGRMRDARALLHESIALARATRCSSAVAWVLCELGSLELDAGHIDESRRAYADALEVAVQLRPCVKIAAACRGLAEAEAAAGDAAAARRWTERAQEERREYDRLRIDARRALEKFALAA